eukprot:gene26568-biopygen16888
MSWAMSCSGKALVPQRTRANRRPRLQGRFLRRSTKSRRRALK